MIVCIDDTDYKTHWDTDKHDFAGECPAYKTCTYPVCDGEIFDKLIDMAGTDGIYENISDLLIKTFGSPQP